MHTMHQHSPAHDYRRADELRVGDMIRHDGYEWHRITHIDTVSNWMLFALSNGASVQYERNDRVTRVKQFPRR